MKVATAAEPALQQGSALLLAVPRWAGAILASATLSLTAGCLALPRRGPLAGPPLPLQPPLHKRVLQGVVPLGQIAWLDNEQLVFPGIRVGTEGDRDKKRALYLWSLQGPARLLLQRADNPCTEGGRIHAWQVQRTPGGPRPLERRPVLLSGPAYNARAAPPPQGRPMVWDANSCASVPLPALLQGHRWQILSRRDGFLDLGPNDQRPRRQQPVEHIDRALQRRDTGLRLDLPLPLHVSPTAWDGSYLLYNFNLQPAERRQWQQGNRLTIWRLDAGFRGRALAVPAGPWVALGGGTIQFFTSRAGLLITSNNFERGGAPGDAGAYLLAPRGRPLRLERGLVEEPVLSPDGCRLAYAHQLHLAASLLRAQRRLVVVDLCSP